MKRIYERIPLKSVLYLIPGNPQIVVRDYATKEDAERDRFPVKTWQGKISESGSPFGGLSYREDAAEIINFKFDPYRNVYVFGISTATDQY